ncbi:MAG: S46 family peptidase, partial [bacterium]|nr:S46 family peptidase [bacterium]
DNWMWPRHTGDFAFMRAYVAPDGSTADYSADNVPFHPKKFLEVAPEGLKTEDFAFILGYPGRTNRHKTSHFLAYDEEIYLPYAVDFYDWVIRLKEKMSEKDRATAIKLSGSIKGYWNAMKRYKGQLKGLKNLQLAKKRAGNEKKLQRFIDADPALKKKYGNLLEEFANIYNEKRKIAHHQLILNSLTSSRTTAMLGNAFTIYEASIERKKKDTERERRYMDRNFDRTKKRMGMGFRNYYEPADKAVLKEILMRAAALKGEYAIPAVQDIIKNNGPEKSIDAFIEKAYQSTKLKDRDVVMGLLKKNKQQLEAMEDSFIVLARAIYPTSRAMREEEKRHKGILDGLLAQLIDVKKKFIGTDFIPDANGTFRLTYGKIRGYTPKDAVYMHPFTTLGGVVEKHNAHKGKHPFTAPEKLLDLYKKKELGRFTHPELKDVPVGILYNMDTTGGNSGSPVMNAKGQLIGLNFDRVFEATINDYAWDEVYSRSIGVDIRYILWFLEKFSGSHHLLKEMGL